MTAGEQLRDYISAEDVASWFCKSLAIPLSRGKPRRMNVGSGKALTLRALAEGWWKQLGAKGRLLAGALPYRENEIMHYVPEITLME